MISSLRAEVGSSRLVGRDVTSEEHPLRLSKGPGDLGIAVICLGKQRNDPFFATRVAYIGF